MATQSTPAPTHAPRRARRPRGRAAGRTRRRARRRSSENPRLAPWMCSWPSASLCRSRHAASCLGAQVVAARVGPCRRPGRVPAPPSGPAASNQWRGTTLSASVLATQSDPRADAAAQSAAAVHAERPGDPDVAGLRDDGRHPGATRRRPRAEPSWHASSTTKTRVRISGCDGAEGRDGVRRPRPGRRAAAPPRRGPGRRRRVPWGPSCRPSRARAAGSRARGARPAPARPVARNASCTAGPASGQPDGLVAPVAQQQVPVVGERRPDASATTSSSWRGLRK